MVEPYRIKIWNGNNDPVAPTVCFPYINLMNNSNKSTITFDGAKLYFKDEYGLDLEKDKDTFSEFIRINDVQDELNFSRFLLEWS